MTPVRRRGSRAPRRPDGADPREHVRPSRDLTIAIVGAGIRGLASAVYLNRQGCRTRIFERLPHVGGIWNRVFSSSVINTPSHAYTFHSSNRWSGSHPSRDEVLGNIRRMVDEEGLEAMISLNTTVQGVTKVARGRWRLEGDGVGEDEYDGVLVCSGFLGRQRRPEPSLSGSFVGPILLPYDFDPALLRGRRVAVVGSGPTALEMLKLARDTGAESAAIVLRPDTWVRDVYWTSSLRICVTGNPFLYLLIKGANARRAATCRGILDVFADGRVKVHRGEVVRTRPDGLVLANGTTCEADVVVWCTGWHSDRPGWVVEHEHDPTLVVAACSRCFNTAGFGYGASSAHAKALLAALRHRLDVAFTSSGSDCPCEQEPAAFGRHIVLGVLRYFLRQSEHRWALLAEGLSYGWNSNLDRIRNTREPLYAKLAAIVNSPLGL